MKTKHILIGLSLLGLIFLTGCGQQPTPTDDTTEETETIKIGFMGPLTGDAAAYGKGIRNGVDLAKKETSISGVEVEMIYKDTKCSPKEATTAAKQLISVQGVDAIIGEVCSGPTLAAAPIAKQNQIPMVSASATSPKLSTTGGEYSFRTVPSDSLQGKFGAELAYEDGQRKMAVLYGNEDYGIGFKDVLKEEFPKLGGEVVAAEAFEPGTADVRTQLTKIKNANPDSLYIISNSPDTAAAALKQMQELGMEDIKVYGSEGLKSSDVIEGSDGGAEGLVVSSVSSGTSDFIQRHKEEYDQGPGPFAAQGYDAYKAVAMALEEGARTGPEIKDQLREIEFEGATGHIEFDENGDVSGNYDVSVVKNGEFVAR